jgi:hypothetical protein
MCDPLLGALLEHTAHQVVAELLHVRSVPHTVELKRIVHVRVSARLGKSQIGVHDNFVPLVAEQVESADD